MTDSLPTYQLLLQYEAARRQRGTALQEFSSQQEIRQDSSLQLELVALDIEIRLQLGERVDISGYMLEFPHLAERLIFVFEEVRKEFLKTFCPFKHKFRCLPDDFAGYEIQHEIGRGGMGVVYQATQTNTQTICAIKVLFFKQDEVSQEAAILAKIDHPNVCQLIDCNVFQSLPYICLELVPGQTVRQLLTQSDRFDPLETAQIIRQIAAGLQKIHELDIVHFDVSTKNIVISKQGKPCLIDFGLATSQPEDDASLPFQTKGTFEFMPPELLNRRFGQPGKQSDVYSLGVVMFTMLTGHNPFMISDEGCLEQICSHPVPRPNDFEDVVVDPELETICLKALRKHVDRRISGMQALVRELDAWIEKAGSRG